MTELDLSSMSVSVIDLVIIALYLVGIVTAGIMLTRRASRDIESYFLGSHRIPWWLVGLSGTASYFDVAGVMWTIAFFYSMGQRFMWPQWMWGGMMMLVVFAAFMGKWLRRSNVMTGAEWMVIRFGDGPAGRFARFSYAVMAVVIAVAFIGFAEYGVGQFMHAFFPDYGPHTLAISLMAVAAIYTVAAGLYGVVLTGVIQFFLMLLGSCVLIVMAVRMSSYELLAAEVPPEWFEFAPPWQWDRMTKWEMTAGFELFTLSALVWVAKGLLLSLGGPQQLYDMQRFLAARSPREASKAGMLWAVAQTPMFMLAASVAVIGIVKWGGDLAHPEQLYPVVVGSMLPVGLKGLVLAGLLSAFMSTFSSTANAGASYVSHDLYHRLIRPGASQSELVNVAKLSSLLIIAAGVVVGMQATNINVIFEWIMMVLGTAVLMPNVLRWFWWRFNGWGYAVGTLVGVAAAIAQVTAFAGTPAYTTFPILFAISVVSSVAASLVTAPTDMDTLTEFCRRIRPAGVWRPVLLEMESRGEELPQSRFGMDLATVVIGTIGVQALWLMSTYAVTHQWFAFSVAGGVVALCAFCLYFTWYKHLPDPDEDLQLATEQTD
jgi:SSS family solute:Na+ symporter